MTPAALDDVPRETIVRLEAYAELLVEANKTQNLIGKSSLADLWARHIVDSAQLKRWIPPGASIVDIGSGAGLPGLVLAIVTASAVTLVEPRTLRAQFLADAARRLGLDRVRVVQGKAAAVRGQFDVITARAVASAPELFAWTLHLAHARTIFLFPKGRSAASELELVNRTWQGEFRLEPSATSDEASILVARRVRTRGKG